MQRNKTIHTGIIEVFMFFLCKSYILRNLYHSMLCYLYMSIWNSQPVNFKDEPGQSQLALDQLGWLCLEERRKHIMARLMFKVVNNLAPSRFSSMFQHSNHIHSYNLRGSNSSLFLPRPNTEYGRKCFRYSGVKIWNSIPEQV
jgi:hypothetical protein